MRYMPITENQKSDGIDPYYNVILIEACKADWSSN